jgi:hypothetical protein
MIQIQRLTAASLVKLRAAGYEGELHHSLSTYAMACRFGWYQLAPGPHNPMLDSTCLLSFGNPDPAWRHQYGAEPGWRTDPARNQAIQGLAPTYWPRTFASARDLDPHDLVQASCKQGFRDTIITLVNRPQGYVAAIMFAALIPLRLDPDKEESPSHIANAFPPP